MTQICVYALFARLSLYVGLLTSTTTCFPPIICTSCSFLSPSEDSLALLPPLVSERDVTIEWMLPRNIAPRQTKVVVWKASDVSAAAATEHIVQSRSDTKMNLVLNPGEVYVYMLLVDVIGGGRLQSNPVHFRMPKGEEGGADTVHRTILYD